MKGIFDVHWFMYKLSIQDGRPNLPKNGDIPETGDLPETGNLPKTGDLPKPAV